MPSPTQPAAGLAQACALWRVDGDRTEPRGDRLAVEEPLEIALSFSRRALRVTQTLALTMRTPGHDHELAAGFLFTEGIVTAANQIESIDTVATEPVTRVQVRLIDDLEVDLRSLERHGTMTSACGVCGKTSAEALRRRPAFVPPRDQPRFSFETIHRLPAALRASQVAFDQTGGLHGAALCNEDGDVLAVFEDVGRHNAVDKVIGTQFLDGGLPLAAEILLVSGRASFELVQKAIMAGLPALAAVGAPSTLAVQIAREAGLTLIGFLRDGRFNVYSGVPRLPELMPAAGEERCFDEDKAPSKSPGAVATMERGRVILHPSHGAFPTSAR
jgi:FdhD protein